MQGFLREREIGTTRHCYRAVTVGPLALSGESVFPIVMGSCALLMPVGGARLARARRYSPAAALGLTLGGIPGVLGAAFIVGSMPLEWLPWLVVILVAYAAVLMLLSAGRREDGGG